MVYYRKYRPQRISELDLLAVRQKLSAILTSKEIPHAFLFAGPKGLGKTSSARILAKALNCENLKEGEPCNTCAACLSITNGSAVDVLEIDAASNRGIDEIRDLRERIKFSPSSLKKKIYIIDEVHMLTTEAFNALLKTLEEPPSHVVFILATTETHKLPATIMSRVFLVPFEKPSEEEIARSLGRVVLGEKLEIEDGVLPQIAGLADGAFRDAAKILEELSLQSKGKKITLELVESLYKTGTIDDSVIKITEASLKKDVKVSLEIIEQLGNQNADFKLVIERMADTLHKKLLHTLSQKNTNELSEVQKFLELLDQAYKELRGTVLPQLPLELAVIEFCIGNSKTESTQQASVVSSPVQQKSTDTSQKKEVIQEKEAKINTTDSSQDFKKLLDIVNAENKILAGLLRGCKLGLVTQDSVQIIASSKFHLGKLTEGKTKETIEKSAQSVWGEKIRLEIIGN